MDVVDVQSLTSQTVAPIDAETEEDSTPKASPEIHRGDKSNAIRFTSPSVLSDATQESCEKHWEQVPGFMLVVTTTCWLLPKPAPSMHASEVCETHVLASLFVQPSMMFGLVSTTATPVPVTVIVDPVHAAEFIDSTADICAASYERVCVRVPLLAVCSHAVVPTDAAALWILLELCPEITSIVSPVEGRFETLTPDSGPESTLKISVAVPTPFPTVTTVRKLRSA
eukprot:2342430-Rhodomonas_salina.4